MQIGTILGQERDKDFFSRRLVVDLLRLPGPERLPLRSVLKRWFLGSVAEDVIQWSWVPVLLVRSDSYTVTRHLGVRVGLGYAMGSTLSPLVP